MIYADFYAKILDWNFRLVDKFWSSPSSVSWILDLVFVLSTKTTEFSSSSLWQKLFIVVNENFRFCCRWWKKHWLLRNQSTHLAVTMLTTGCWVALLHNQSTHLAVTALTTGCWVALLHNPQSKHSPGCHSVDWLLSGRGSSGSSRRVNVTTFWKPTLTSASLSLLSCHD